MIFLHNVGSSKNTAVNKTPLTNSLSSTTKTSEDLLVSDLINFNTDEEVEKMLECVNNNVVPIKQIKKKIVCEKNINEAKETLLHQSEHNLDQHDPLSELFESKNDEKIVASQSVTSLTTYLGPAALVGGTTAVYVSALQRTTSTLTPLSTLYLMLLAIQYSIQPRLSKKYIDKRTNKQTVSMMEEISKASMAALVLLTNSFFSSRKFSPSTISPFSSWSLQSSLIVAGIPAMIYAIQNVLTYTSQQYLDSVTFNGLSQTKTLSAALCCYFLLKKKQSFLQVISLGILFLSSLVFQGVFLNAYNNRSAKQQHQKKQAENKYTSITPPNKTSKNKLEWFKFGVLPCLGASILSGLAGACSQKAMQQVGTMASSGRNAFLYTIEVSSFSALCLFTSLLMSNRKSKQKDVSDSGCEEKEQDKSLSLMSFEHWTSKTWIPILVKAFGGVLTALVHKHAGSVMKGFALMFGLVLSNFLQQTLFSSSNEETGGNSNKKMSSREQNNQVIGTLLVILSSWMHFTNPPSTVSP